MTNKKQQESKLIEDLKQAVEKELQRKPRQFHDALFLRTLRCDYEDGDWDTHAMDVVKSIYGLK